MLSHLLTLLVAFALGFVGGILYLLAVRAELDA